MLRITPFKETLREKQTPTLSGYTKFFPWSQGLLTEAAFLWPSLRSSTAPITFHTCFVILASACMATHWNRLRNCFNQTNIPEPEFFVWLFLMMPDRFSNPLKTWPSCCCGSNRRNSRAIRAKTTEVNRKAQPPKHLLRFNAKGSKIQQSLKNVTWSVIVTQITNLSLHHSSSVLCLNSLCFNSTIP